MAFLKFASFLLLLLLLLLFMAQGAVNAAGASLSQSYHVIAGYDHVALSDDGQEIQLSLDAASGSGFQSWRSYRSGVFNMQIKVPGRNSAGVVTSFYLTSHGGRHDEVDFEFLGNREGKPILLQTNVFADGVGNREERILLWFDPTADFHSYKVLWNNHQIVFYVDDIPIRVFKNNPAIGVPYLTEPMQIEASLWDGDNWATDKGLTKIDWSYAPFLAHYRGFDISGCVFRSQDCDSLAYWWNSQEHRSLDGQQEKQLDNVRKNFMYYDYCTDTSKHPVPPPECP
ncbi:xyloglucan endotransglucosylase/hydrolase protein 2-like [Rhodamnia argentea]|uniref:Xyloglucan endotransglucosylase/hydrolase n=1 Tax=Rhodamnia argentea TaxID=178133 RepID=A0A8B8QKX6_9MYRT|nr:xyloglucan endotransglucosylase/hydrolase protein 2-like [Rhodamnia argentea]